MGRILLWAVLLGIALFALRRALGGGSPRPPRRKLEERDAPATLVCAACSTRYDPKISGGVCPRCGK